MNIHLSIAMAVLVAAAARAEESGLAGANLEAVKAMLGEPRAYICQGAQELLLYDRGQVELQEGVVVKARLISEEEAERVRQERAREAEAQRVAAEQARARRIEEGTRALAVKLSHTEFFSAPASERLAYWQGFRTRYPEVPLPEDYEMALRERQIELTERTDRAERERRLADLEARVRDAEERARRAEEEVRRSSVRGYFYTGGYYTGVCYPGNVVACDPYASRRYLTRTSAFPPRNISYTRPALCAPSPVNCRPARTVCALPSYTRAVSSYSCAPKSGFTASARVRF